MSLFANLGDVYVLLEKIESPLNPAVALRDQAGQSFYPTEHESLKIETAVHRHGGIGIFPRNRSCSLFIWENMEEATRTAAFLTGISGLEEFFKTCAVLRDLLNQELFIFAFMMAIQNRTDTGHLPLPPIEEVLPQWFFPTEVINAARRQLIVAPDEQTPVIVDYVFSGTPLDPEHKMAYFREDIAINSHHWHWHLVYPFTWRPTRGQIRDRKGELFYYMHQQVLARYDADRLSNNLNRVRTFDDLDKPIEEGYAPKLLSVVSGTYYPVRPANRKLSSVPDVINVPTLTTWLNRFMQAVHTRSVVNPDDSKTTLMDPEGIDTLGAIVESAATSVNPRYYGSYHNLGHVAIASIHDPDGWFGGDASVMGFTATAMRDPVFYRWHKNIDDIFNEYKLSLPPYTTSDLAFSDVQIANVFVKGQISTNNNVLRTFWQERIVSINRGMDFGAANPIRVKTRHLQHEEFVHNIEVNNASTSSKEVMVRIFIAPKFNERQQPYLIGEQRRLFIQLDTFLANLAPSAITIITRSSLDSNVTIPTAKTFQQLADIPITASFDSTQSYCGCGWPHHMLLPKGRAEGMTFTYFVMLTDGAADKIVSRGGTPCVDAVSYCGLMNRLYPDRRSMGFPFDRLPQNPMLNAQDFASSAPNMRASDIVIRHTGEIVGQDGITRHVEVF